MANITLLLKGLIGTRPPRLMFVGQRGVGKTTLLNALFRAGIEQEGIGCIKGKDAPMQWCKVQTGRGKQFWVLDTRGYKGKPDETVGVVQAIRQNIPDIVLFLIKATSIDTDVDSDISAIQQIFEYIDRFERRTTPLLIVLTQSDEIEPRNVRSVVDKERFPEEWGIKEQHIRQIVSSIESRIKRNPVLMRHFRGIIPTSAYVRIRPDGTVDPDPEFDFRWNIEYLARRIQDVLPFESKAYFAQLASLKEWTARYRRSVRAGALAAAVLVPWISQKQYEETMGILSVLIAKGILEEEIQGNGSVSKISSINIAAGIGLTYDRLLRHAGFEKQKRANRSVLALAMVFGHSWLTDYLAKMFEKEEIDE